jgi:hypothetical protein
MQENLEFIPNFFNTVSESTSKYFLFIGDDDDLHADALQQLVNLLEGEEEFGMVVQHLDSSKNQGETVSLSRNQTLRYFYDFGNAWCGVYRADSCREILKDKNLRGLLEKNIWSQVSLGFLALEKSGYQAVYFPETLGFVNRERPYKWEGELLGTSLVDLMEAASFTGAYHSDKDARVLRSGLSKVIRKHVLGIASSAARTEMPKEKVREAANAVFRFETISGIPEYLLMSLTATRIGYSSSMLILKILRNK